MGGRGTRSHRRIHFIATMAEALKTTGAIFLITTTAEVLEDNKRVYIITTLSVASSSSKPP
jgi:hypothetical protein